MSQKQDILRFLAQSKPLTPLVALAKFKTFRLSARIMELRNEGWPINSKLVKRGDAWVAEYRMVT